MLDCVGCVNLKRAWGPAWGPSQSTQNICITLDQRRRRWADVLQMLYKCFVFARISRHPRILRIISFQLSPISIGQIERIVTSLMEIRE